MGKVKICYKDGNNTKLLLGVILSKDEDFFKILTEDKTEFQLNKNAIISIKNLSGDGQNGRNNT